MPLSIKFLDDTGGTRILTYMGAYSHPLLKASYLYGNLPTIGQLIRPKPTDFKKSTAIDEYYTKSAGGGVTGGKRLPGAAEYTPAYCNAIFKAWKRSADFVLPAC
eukprot:5714094-Alexandrium_andersonii.AAC.1